MAEQDNNSLVRYRVERLEKAIDKLDEDIRGEIDKALTLSKANAAAIAQLQVEITALKTELRIAAVIMGILLSAIIGLVITHIGTSVP